MAGNAANGKHEKNILVGNEYNLALLLLEKGAISFERNDENSEENNKNLERILDETANFKLNFGKVINNVKNVSMLLGTYIINYVTHELSKDNHADAQKPKGSNGSEEKQPSDVANHIHGPANSGISVAENIKSYLEDYWDHKVTINWSYSDIRKEEITGEIKKDDKIIIVDDFLCSGKTMKQTYELVKKTGAEVVAIVFMMDAMEVDEKKRRVIDGLREDLNVPVYAALNIEDVAHTFHNKNIGNNGNVYVNDDAMKGLKSYLRKKKHQTRNEPIENYLEEE
jgi:orotate phosphoribosyltransferase